MQDFEKLGVFYLGRVFDLDKQQPQDDLLLYESKDLTTHAVCVGMTGSGKTGLSLALLEEAAIDGIPAIAIDPKGDLGNLLLTFPDLQPADFQPWIDPREATRQQLTVEQLAAKTAEKWKNGLATSGEDGARIARFQSAVDRAIYTPGSNAGLPLAVLKSFAAPSAAVRDDNEALRDRISAAVSGLLALLGIDADPLRSREHILLSNLLDRAWREGRDLDMGGLIREIQSPPLERIGVVDLENFFPAKERFALAMSLNNLLASPGFAAWMEGEPLDIQRLLYTPEGKPRISILSIAHLSDAERMFFVTILLNEVISWMRTQGGTSSLRALLFMDEVFGYFPPTANPPSKLPMLTLLKQARAFGLGVVLSTQNPVDLDYKGLSNAGTWLLGRLQTERDKARVLDGLEGASAAAGAKFDRRRMETILSGLGNRAFLMNNVHEDEPVVFQSRWALSYLSGPLTREQISTLMKDRKQAAASAPVAAASRPVTASSGAGGERPVLPPDVPEAFLPRRGTLPAGARLVYYPALLGTAKVHFAQTTSGVDVWETLSLVAPLDGGLSDNVWESVEPSTEEPELEKSPEAASGFASLPSELSKAKQYAQCSTLLKDHLYRSHTLSLWKCKAVKQFSQPGESEADFRVRLSQSTREGRDALVEKLRAKYAPKLASLQEQIRKAQQRVEKEKSQASQQTMQTVISFGTSILNAVFGRKLMSAGNVGRVATSARQAGRILREREDVGHAEDTVESLQKRLADLEVEFKAETESATGSMSADTIALEPLELKPKKSDINISRVALLWLPYVVNADGEAKAAY